MQLVTQATASGHDVPAHYVLDDVGILPTLLQPIDLLPHISVPFRRYLRAAGLDRMGDIVQHDLSLIATVSLRRQQLPLVTQVLQEYGLPLSLQLGPTLVPAYRLACEQQPLRKITGSYPRLYVLCECCATSWYWESAKAYGKIKRLNAAVPTQCNCGNYFGSTRIMGRGVVVGAGEVLYNGS